MLSSAHFHFHYPRLPLKIIKFRFVSLVIKSARHNHHPRPRLPHLKPFDSRNFQSILIGRREEEFMVRLRRLSSSSSHVLQESHRNTHKFQKHATNICDFLTFPWNNPSEHFRSQIRCSWARNHNQKSSFLLKQHLHFYFDLTYFCCTDFFFFGKTLLNHPRFFLFFFHFSRPSNQEFRFFFIFGFWKITGVPSTRHHGKL